MRVSKFIKGFSACTLAACAVFSAAAWGSLKADAYGLERHTQAEIKAKFQELYFSVNDEPTYAEDYSTTSPYSAGKLSDEELQAALNSVNFTRYVAGLPYDVKLDSNYSVYAQHSSLVNYMNNSLSHFPSQPSGLPDDLYELGYSGSGRSNIAMGFGNVASSVIAGYMEDSDNSNIDRVGHRRWVLNPPMQYTGFGYVGNATAMYAFDMKRSDDFTGDYICWPAENTPYELVRNSDSTNGYAYSITLGNTYDTPSRSKVTVDVTSKKLGKSWHLDSSSNTYAGNYLNVENSGYGMSKCIIFNVGDLPEDDTVSVTVKGIYKNGVEKPISYTVNYFNMLDDNDYPVGFEKSEYDIEVGETIRLNGCHNPLITENYSIWYGSTALTYSNIKLLGGGAFEITGKEEGSFNIWLGTSSQMFNNTKTTINVTHKHIESGWIIDKQATTTSTGSRHKECTKCGKVLQTETIPMKEITTINDCTISLAQTAYTYDGTAKTPAVTVKAGSKTLTKGTDYTLEYSANVNAGTAYVKVTGKGTYSGTYAKTYTISARNVSACTVTLSADTNYFRGTRVKPVVTVKIGNTVIPASNYSLSYGDNLSVGTAKVTIKGKNNLTGSYVKKFEIIPRSVGNCDIEMEQAAYFNGTRIKPSVKIVCNGTVLYSGNYTLTYKNNLSAGTASVVITGKNNLKGSVTKTFKINPRSIKNCTVELKKNTSSPAKPLVSVKIGSNELYSGNYTVSYSAVSSGKVTVTVTGKGNLKDTVKLTYTV